MKKTNIVFEKVKNFFTKVSRQKFLAHSIFGAAILFIVLTVVIPTNKVYGLTFEDNDYQIIRSLYRKEQGPYYYNGVQVPNLYYSNIGGSSTDMNDLRLSYWNDKTMVVSYVILNTSKGVGIDYIPSSIEFPMVEVLGNSYEDLITAYRSSSGIPLITLHSTGVDEETVYDITSDVSNDNFVGFILNTQFEVDSGNQIQRIVYTIQVVQLINNQWNIVSYPYAYRIYNQVPGFSIQYTWALENIALKEYPAYSNMYVISYEHLESNLYDNGIPNLNIGVWNKNGLSILKYLENTDLITTKSYDFDSMREEYYNDGYTTGKKAGYSEGYTVGLEEGENVTTNWIATISKGVGHVLSLEIAPNLPLGLLVAIPVCLGMIMLIITFWRKD